MKTTRFFHFKKYTQLWLPLLCAATLGLAGCSGGGAGATIATTITVIDGYIKGATVCVDKNKNGACDLGETQGETGADGKVTLNIPAADVGKYRIVAYVPADAIDSDTDEAVGTAFTLKAPKEHSGVVSPFTTLVVQKLDANKNLSLADAQSQVATSTGFEVSVLSSDFMSKPAARTLARTTVALQKNRLAALNALSTCTASQDDKESQVSAAIASALALQSNKTIISEIKDCSTAVEHKKTACKTAIDTAVTTIVKDNNSLSTASLQDGLSDVSCHTQPTQPVQPTQTATITSASSGGTPISSGGRTDSLKPTLSGTYTGNALGSDYSVHVLDGSTDLGAATVTENSKTWTFTPATDLSPGSHSFTAVVVRTSNGAKGTASDAFTVKVGNSVSASNTPNAWDEFTLTLSKVWSNVNSVVFTFATNASDMADDFATKTVNLASNAWDSVTTAFKTAANKTITAKFFDGDDGKGTQVDSNSFNLTVGSASVTQTATITDVKDGNTSIPDNGTTTKTKPTISGTVSPALAKYYKVNLYDGDSVLAGTMTYGDPRTSWTFTPDTALRAGSHSLTAKVATFDGGATGSASGTRTFTTPPHPNDTGITAAQCYGAGNNTLISCASAEATSLNSQQDGMVGRDVTSSDGTDGKLGFSFSEVPIAGGAGNYARTECVKDNITGLMWEGKPPTGSSRGNPPLDYNGYYTNYITGNQVNANSNAQGYVNAVNAAGLCGHKDWRLPTASELQSIVDYGVARPTIDAVWFPNTDFYFFWTSSHYVDDSRKGWGVSFSDGNVDYENNLREYATYVRLVR